MKKTFLVLLICLLVSSSFPATAELRHVYDASGKFSTDTAAKLEAKAESIYRRHGTDVMIVTTNDSKGKTPMLYAADFYESVRDYTSFDSYVVFAFCFDIGEYGEAAYGPARSMLSAQGDDALYQVLAPYLPSREYGKAMNAYLNYVDRTLTRGEVSGSTHTVRDEEDDVATRFFASGGWIVIVAFVVSLIIVQAFKAQMKIARSRSNAGQYVLPGSLQLRESSDLYLYETTSRVRIESSSSSSHSNRSFSSGSSHSSGGHSFSSSSGRSYGGRSGKL